MICCLNEGSVCCLINHSFRLSSDASHMAIAVGSAHAMTWSAVSISSPQRGHFWHCRNPHRTMLSFVGALPDSNLVMVIVCRFLAPLEAALMAPQSIHESDSSVVLPWSFQYWRNFGSCIHSRSCLSISWAMADPGSLASISWSGRPLELVLLVVSALVPLHLYHTSHSFGTFDRVS